MSADRGDGGAAFSVHGGMRLRDWFAGKQAASMRSADPNFDLSSEDLAHLAYVDADAMLEERKR